MTQFDNTVFDINPEMVITTIETPLARVSIIDNYYKDFDAVCTEIDKLPYATTSLSNDDMFDARKSYVGNMAGTRFSFPDKHSDIVANIIGYNGKTDTNQALLVNCNTALSDKYKEYYYNAHTDLPNSGRDTISTVIMLNETYNEGEGLNTYNSDKLHFNSWIPRTDLELNTFIQAKPNRAILFSALLPHGAAFTTSQFREEMRYTQVIFTHLV